MGQDVDRHEHHRDTADFEASLRAVEQEKLERAIRPLHDRIVVRRTKAPDKTDGGIFIPDAAKEKQVSGTVLAVGRGQYTESGGALPLDVHVGDLILFAKYSGIQAGETFTMQQVDVIGVLKPGEGTELSRFHPTGPKMVIEPVDEVYRGQIIIPGHVKKDPPTRGIVRAMGPGMLILNGARVGQRWPMSDVPIGGTVVFYAQSSTPIRLDGKEYLTVRDEAVIAVIE